MDKKYNIRGKDILLNDFCTYERAFQNDGTGARKKAGTAGHGVSADTQHRPPVYHPGYGQRLLRHDDRTASLYHDLLRRRPGLRETYTTHDSYAFPTRVVHVNREIDLLPDFVGNKLMTK